MQAAARPGCAGPKREVGAWVARSGCDLGTEVKQGGIGVGHVEKPSCWGKQPCRLARRTIFLLLENSPIGPGVLALPQFSKGSQSSRLPTVVGSSL